MKNHKTTITCRVAWRASGILFLAAAVLSLAGCSSESADQDLLPSAAAATPANAVLPEPSGTLPPPVLPPPAAGVQPVAAVGSAVTPFNQPDQGANDQAMAKLNEGLRKFYAQYQRAPYTTDELVAEKFVESMPAAPAGKEYFYDSVGLRFKLINKRPE